jgi:hypothetical protein
LRALKNESVARDIEIQNHQVQIGAAHAQISQLNEVVKEAKLAAEKAAKELQFTHFRVPWSFVTTISLFGIYVSPSHSIS